MKTSRDERAACAGCDFRGDLNDFDRLGFDDVCPSCGAVDVEVLEE